MLERRDGGDKETLVVYKELQTALVCAVTSLNFLLSILAFHDSSELPRT